MVLDSFSSTALRSSLIYYVPAAYLIYFCLRAVYRVTWHPLAKFPGPKIAAITRGYEVYWEVIKDGRYTHEIERMHQKYGPIVRINPFQLHVSDPAFYDQLYNFSKHIDRPWATLDNLQQSPSFEVHRVRRKALGAMFTKTAILNRESMIQKNVDLLCQRFAEAKHRGDIVNLAVLFRCLTSDVILEMTFGEPYGFLEAPDKARIFFESQNSIFKTLYLFREYRLFHIIILTLALLPSWLTGNSLGGILPFIKDSAERTKRARARGEDTKSPEESGSIINVYANDPELAPTDKGDAQLVDTVLLFLSAGFETTGFTLETIFYYLLSNPKMLKRVQEEIETAFPKSQYAIDARLPLTKIEQLPYLNAVIDEALRLSLGVMSRLPRLNSHSDMTYGGYTIPKGTHVGMTQRLIHYSPEFYPEPHKFNPERWMQGAKSQDLKKHWMPFSRGARVCIGQNLAYAELYITVATIFHRGLHFELFDTTIADIEPVIDYFIPKPVSDKGVRVKIT